MAESTQHRKFQRLVQKFEPQSKLIRVWGLKGGVSAQTTKIEIRQPDGQSKKLVVRRHGPGDLERNSNITTDEFRLLRITGESGLPTPTPYYLDAMKIFTERYESMMSLDFTNLPIWDLYAALRPAFRFADWAEDDVAERAMREGHRLFVAQAFETLSARH